jgi:hypothetical protein
VLLFERDAARGRIAAGRAGRFAARALPADRDRRGERARLLCNRRVALFRGEAAADGGTNPSRAALSLLLHGRDVRLALQQFLHGARGTRLLPRDARLRSLPRVPARAVGRARGRVLRLRALPCRLAPAECDARRAVRAARCPARENRSAPPPARLRGGRIGDRRSSFDRVLPEHAAGAPEDLSLQLGFPGDAEPIPRPPEGPRGARSARGGRALRRIFRFRERRPRIGSRLPESASTHRLRDAREFLRESPRSGREGARSRSRPRVRNAAVGPRQLHAGIGTAPGRADPTLRGLVIPEVSPGAGSSLVRRRVSDRQRHCRPDASNPKSPPCDAPRRRRLARRRRRGRVSVRRRIRDDGDVAPFVLPVQRDVRPPADRASPEIGDGFIHSHQK